MAVALPNAGHGSRRVAGTMPPRRGTVRLNGQVRRLLLVAVEGEWGIDDITDAKGGEGLRETLNGVLASHKSAHRR